MTVPNPSAIQTYEASSNGDVRQLYPWMQLLIGFPGLEGAITLFSGPSVFSSGADADLTQLAAVACSQAAVLGWKKLREVDWDKAWLNPGDGAVTILLSHLPRQAWIGDFVFKVTWNIREDLLCKDYFRFLRREVCYPYNKETKNKWFTAEVTRKEEVDGKNTDIKYEIKALNSTDKNRTEMSEEEKIHLELESKPGYWFHGTCHTSAVDILEEGIKLGAGKPSQDFSSKDGFYMSPKFTCTKHWAMKNHGQAAAVIVFNVGNQLEDESLQGLDLTGSGKEADWITVVKYNRCGRSPSRAPLSGELRQRFDKSDYITGPMSAGFPSNEKSACQKWRPEIIRKLPNQLCIRKQRLAEVFGSPKDKHIEAVVFYGD